MTLPVPGRDRKAALPNHMPLGSDEISESYLDGRPMPLVLSPKRPSKLDAWLRAHWAQVEARLFHHGAILFRGFDLPDLVDFENAVAATGVTLTDYVENTTPRTKMSETVFTATEFPNTQTIAHHNENSAATVVPLKLFFYCKTPPPQGGQTPISDVRKVYGAIDPGIREEFERRGWSLIRNFGTGLGLSWQEAFHTEDRDVVAAYCSKNDIEFKWQGKSRLSTRQVRKATLTHPITGDTVWFNHMSFWHPANLNPAVREMLTEELGEDGLPFQSRYGDDGVIPDPIAHHVRDAYLQNEVVFDWHHGDFMIIDNILTSHGRKPFTGQRKILVSLGEPHQREG